MLEFQDGACVILGVEMGAAHVMAVLTDLRGRVLECRERSHPVRSDPEGTRALIVELCEACLASHPGAAAGWWGSGSRCRARSTPAAPTSVGDRPPRLAGRERVRSAPGLYGVPVLVDNDANLGALAEGWWGAGSGVDDFAYVKIATGVGSGHVIGGRIYRGATGVAGEIGHMAIDPHGGPCICGLRGCLATLVGAPALVERARSLLVEYPGQRSPGRRSPWTPSWPRRWAPTPWPFGWCRRPRNTSGSRWPASSTS